MKTLNVIFCGLISLFLLACGNDLDVKYTLCKDKVSSRSKLSPNVDEHYLTYRVDGKTLKVELYNYMGSCGTEEIKVEPTRGESNQLIVKITEGSNEIKRSRYGNESVSAFSCALGMRYHLAVRVRYRLGSRNC